MLGSMLAHWTAARIANDAGVAYKSTADVLLGTTFGLEGLTGTLAMLLMGVVKVAIGERVWWCNGSCKLLIYWNRSEHHFRLEAGRQENDASYSPDHLPKRIKTFRVHFAHKKTLQGCDVSAVFAVYRSCALMRWCFPSDYTSVPRATSLRPIPSFIDLPSEEALASALPETAGNLLRSRGRSLSGAKTRPSDLPAPRLEVNGNATPKTALGRLENDGSNEGKSPPHYDVDGERMRGVVGMHHSDAS